MVTRLVEALKAHPKRLVAAALAAALVASLPSLPTGFYLDDHVHQYALSGLPGPGGGLRLYDFTPADPTQLAQYIRQGPYPWWTSPELKVRFFRPLSSALMQADRVAFGDDAVRWHLHSLCWGLALVVAGWLLLRRLLPGLAGPLALLFFALSQSHAMAVLWIANRNALVAAVPALFGFAAHLRWRQDGWRPGAFLSSALYALALCGGEAALGLLAYPLAWELLAGPGRWRERLRALLPVLVPAAAYVAVYRLGGFGARDSGIYLDPGAEPLAYAAAAPVRFVVLAGNLLVDAPVDLWLPAPAARPYIVAESLLGLALAAWLFRRMASDAPPEERRVARFLAVAAALALVPTVATFPMARLVLPASLAGAALLALFARTLWRRGPRPLLWLLLLTHVGLSGLYWPGLARFAGGVRDRVDQAVAAMEVERDWERLRVVVLNCPDPAAFLYMPLQRAVAQRTSPRAWLTLTQLQRDLRLTRVSERAFELEVVDGRLLDSVYEQVVRTMAKPFAVGDTVQLDGADVTVLAVDEGHPTRIRFTLDVPLEDPGVRVVWWHDGTFRRFPLPAVGVTVALPFEPGPMGR